MVRKVVGIFALRVRSRQLQISRISPPERPGERDIRENARGTGNLESARRTFRSGQVYAVFKQNRVPEMAPEPDSIRR